MALPHSLVNLTIVQAADAGWYTVERWDTWGPKGMSFPVGSLPRFAPPPLWELSFGRWKREGLILGLDVKPLQSPLYYFLVDKQLWAMARQTLYPSCSMYGCGKAMRYAAVMVKHRRYRQDLCGDHCKNLRKRGLLESDDVEMAAAA